MKAKKPVKLTFDSNGIPLVWLTWGLRANGLCELATVSITRKHSEYARTVIQQMIEGETMRPLHESNPYIRTWTEQRQAEHIFAMSQDSQMMALASMTRPR